MQRRIGGAFLSALAGATMMPMVSAVTSRQIVNYTPLKMEARRCASTTTPNGGGKPLSATFPFTKFFKNHPELWKQVRSFRVGANRKGDPAASFKKFFKGNPEIWKQLKLDMEKASTSEKKGGGGRANSAGVRSSSSASKSSVSATSTTTLQPSKYTTTVHSSKFNPKSRGAFTPKQSFSLPRISKSKPFDANDKITFGKLSNGQNFVAVDATSVTDTKTVFALKWIPIPSTCLTVDLRFVSQGNTVVLPAMTWEAGLPLGTNLTGWIINNKFVFGYKENGDGQNSSARSKPGAKQLIAGTDGKKVGRMSMPRFISPFNKAKGTSTSIKMVVLKEGEFALIE